MRQQKIFISLFGPNHFVSFQGQRNIQKYKNPNKIISFKTLDFCKLYTLSKLVILLYII